MRTAQEPQRKFAKPSDPLSTIHPRAAFFRDLRPARDVGLDELAEFLRRAADRLEAEARDALAHLCAPKRLDDLFVELRDHGVGSSRRGEEAVPADTTEPRHR